VYNGITIPVEDVAASAGWIVKNGTKTISNRIVKIQTNVLDDCAIKSI